MLMKMIGYGLDEINCLFINDLLEMECFALNSMWRCLVDWVVVVVVVGNNLFQSQVSLSCF